MHNIEISTEDCKIIVASLEATKFATAWASGEKYITQDFLDNLQRIRDGFQELVEFGGR